MLILLTGKARAGKDTVGAYLCRCYGFKHDSLAAPIKRLVSDVFAVPPSMVHDEVRRECSLEHWPGWTVRKLLQYIGTELFRTHIAADIWVRSLWLRHAEDEGNLVVTDCRFPNEQSYLREHYQGPVHTWKVVRPTCDGRTEGGIAGHASEAHDLEADQILDNSGDFVHLYRQVDKAMQNVSVCTEGAEVSA